jgi:hypothetical protein
MLVQSVGPGANGVAREPVLEWILRPPSLYILPDRLENDSRLIHSFDRGAPAPTNGETN